MPAQSSLATAAAPADLSVLGVDIPEIDADVRTYQQELGAEFDVGG